MSFDLNLTKITIYIPSKLIISICRQENTGVEIN